MDIGDMVRYWDAPKTYGRPAFGYPVLYSGLYASSPTEESGVTEVDVEIIESPEQDWRYIRQHVLHLRKTTYYRMYIFDYRSDIWGDF